MPRSRSPCALALGLALLVLLTTPVAAQRPTDEAFRAFLGAPAAVTGPLLSSDEASPATSAEPPSPTVASLAAWLDQYGIYVVGSVAAAGTGLMLSTPSHAAAAPRAAPTGAPAATKPPIAPAGAPTAGPAPAAPTTIVNPEPGTVLLLATGLAGLGLLARRRSARA